MGRDIATHSIDEEVLIGGKSVGQYMCKLLLVDALRASEYSTRFRPRNVGLFRRLMNGLHFGGKAKATLV
jgi:hypothetical protein